MYAVGDVHGCASRLAALHRMIARDLAERPVAEATLVHLGDYIDRGPDSAAVVAMLLHGPAVPAARVVNLMGNHEDMMLAALTEGGSESAVHWMANGGAESLRSWCVPERRRPAQWCGFIPEAHLAFLRGLALSHREGPYLFVHAGIRPGVPLDRQSREDLVWIREPFLSWPGELGAVVVHGHTPSREPVVKANRIGIDTGAVIGGKLTCGVLEGDRVGILAA